LSYSTQPDKAAAEIRRVTRKGGIVAIAVEYSTMSPDDEVRLLGYAIEDSARRLNSTKDLEDLFLGHVGRVYFEHDAPNRISHSALQLMPNVSNVALVFELT
jgi:hypothetical protein